MSSASDSLLAVAEKAAVTAGVYLYKYTTYIMKSDVQVISIDLYLL